MGLFHENGDRRQNCHFSRQCVWGLCVVRRVVYPGCIRVVCIPDLLRFCRIFYHCSRCGRSHGFSTDGKLQSALLCSQCERFLEQMAYFPDIMVQGLSLHSFGRQPERKTQKVCESDDRFPCKWSLAWSHMVLCDLGRFERCLYGCR